MSPEEFEFISALLKERSGLCLTEEKIYLLESRLMPIVRTNGLQSVSDLLWKLRSKPTEELLVEITEAMMINESFFFRDQKPFDRFQNTVLPYLIKKRTATQQISIWSAAAATGQEAYSLALLFAEQARTFHDWQIDILATDISGKALQRARNGTYTQFEIQRGLPIMLVMKYFQQDSTGNWVIDSAIKDKIVFDTFNLLDDMSSLGPFDVIFCRNVLIYFDSDLKKRVLEKLADRLLPDGFLFLGGAETIMGTTNRLTSCPDMRGIYTLS